MLVQTGGYAGPPRGNSRSGKNLWDRPSGRGLRRDTRGYYLGVGTPGGLAGLVLPLSKCLVHRDTEPDRAFPKIRGHIIITFADRESL